MTLRTSSSEVAARTTISYDVRGALWHRHRMTLRHEPDVSHADWFVRGSDPWGQLCTIGPRGFAAYARIMHPSDDPSEDDGLLSCEGDLPEDLGLVLSAVLGRHTTTPDDCFFALWDGWGEIYESMVTRIEPGHGSSSWKEPPALAAEVRTGSRIRIPNREYFLFRGPLHDAGRWPSRGNARINSPNLIWPADHSFFVATDTDSPWTGVGGSVDLIAELLSHDVLDAVPASASPDLPYGRG
jgi:hypothetical protein